MANRKKLTLLILVALASCATHSVNDCWWGNESFNRECYGDKYTSQKNYKSSCRP